MEYEHPVSTGNHDSTGEKWVVTGRLLMCPSLKQVWLPKPGSKQRTRSRRISNPSLRICRMSTALRLKSVGKATRYQPGAFRFSAASSIGLNVTNLMTRTIAFVTSKSKENWRSFKEHGGSRKLMKVCAFPFR